VYAYNKAAVLTNKHDITEPCHVVNHSNGVLCQFSVIYCSGPASSIFFHSVMCMLQYTI